MIVFLPKLPRSALRHPCFTSTTVFTSMYVFIFTYFSELAGFVPLYSWDPGQEHLYRNPCWSPALPKFRYNLLNTTKRKRNCTHSTTLTRLYKNTIFGYEVKSGRKSSKSGNFFRLGSKFRLDIFVFWDSLWATYSKILLGHPTARGGEDHWGRLAVTE